MHIAMGKRNSGCDTSFIPMMGSGFGNMMGGWGGFSVFGWLSMILFWLLVILGVVALVRYLAKSGSSKEDKTPLDMSNIKTIAILACPKCGKEQSVTMPTDACQHFYKCVSCGEMLKPKEGDCCVFCSYADTKCPPKQLEAQQ